MLDVKTKFKKIFQMLDDKDTLYGIDMLYETPSVDDWENVIIFVKFLKKNL